MNPVFKRAQQASKIGETGRRSEKRIAKSIGGRLTGGSGSKNHDKGDIDVGNWRIESKSTTGVSLRLDIGWLAKIKREALEKDQQPALTVSFVNPDGTAIEEWAMVPMSVMRELCGFPR